MEESEGFVASELTEEHAVEPGAPEATVAEPVTPEGLPPAPEPAPAPVSAELLDRTVRSLRRWIVALTVLMAVVTAIALTVVGFTVFGMVQSGFFASTDPGPNAALGTDIKDAIEGSFGDKVESVDVYQAEVRSDDLGTDVSRPFAVTYRLKGTGVNVSGYVYDLTDIAQLALDPTKGYLDSQLTDEAFLNLIAEFKKHSDGPLGYMYEYGSSDYSDYQSSDTINVDGKPYAVKDLWCVNEGYVSPKGKVVKASDIPTVRTLVFKIDRSKQTFTYVGSQPADLPAFESDYYGD